MRKGRARYNGFIVLEHPGRAICEYFASIAWSKGKELIGDKYNRCVKVRIKNKENVLKNKLMLIGICQ